MRRVPSLILAALAFVVPTAAFPAGASLAEPPLEPGTIIEVSIVGIPEYKYRVPVDAKGNVTVPLLPTIQASAMDLAELRARIKADLPKRPFRSRTADGKDSYVNFGADEISVEVAEWRPFYVDGDVGKPGELPYRPGLTVRQAVAMAGGLDLLHSRVANPFMESADVRSEYTASWTELAKLQAQVAGIRASIDGKPDTNIRSQMKAPLKPAELDRIAANETDRLKGAEMDYAKEGKYLGEAVDQTKIQIDALTEQMKRTEESAKQQQADYERIKGLYDKNIVPVNRLSEEQRQLAFASERLLAVTAQISQARLSQQEYKRKRDALGDQRRVKLLSDLQEANLRLATVKARIGALDEKLIYTGAAKAQLRKEGSTPPTYFITRKQDGGERRVQVREDDSVRSGDVVEVAVPQPMPELN